MCVEGKVGERGVIDLNSSFLSPYNLQLTPKNSAHELTGIGSKRPAPTTRCPNSADATRWVATTASRLHPPHAPAHSVDATTTTQLATR